MGARVISSVQSFEFVVVLTLGQLHNYDCAQIFEVCCLHVCAISDLCSLLELKINIAIGVTDHERNLREV